MCLRFMMTPGWPHTLCLSREVLSEARSLMIIMFHIFALSHLVHIAAHVAIIIAI